MGLLQNMIDEPVSRLSLRTPVECGPEDSVRVAVERMREQKLGCVIVVDVERKPIGIFTESLLTQLLVRSPEDLGNPIKVHMAKQFPWVKQTDPIVDVLEAMQLKNVRFICVLDEEGRVAALTGQKGLMEYIAEHFPGQVMVQRVGCAPYVDREGA